MGRGVGGGRGDVERGIRGGIGKCVGVWGSNSSSSSSLSIVTIFNKIYRKRKQTM